MRKAAETVAALPTYGTQWPQRFRDLITDMESARAPDSRGSELRAGGFVAEERQRSIATLELVTRFCDALAARPGRTALVWVSTGVMLTEGGPAAAMLAAEQDAVGGELGATRVVLEMPDSTIGWRTSDLVLGVVGESRNPKPVVARKVVEGQRVVAFLEVNGGLSPTISGSLYQVGDQRGDDEEPELEHVSEIRLSLMRRHPDRVQRGAIMLPEDMPPGEYIFEVRIEDPPADQERTFRVPLEVLSQ